MRATTLPAFLIDKIAKPFEMNNTLKKCESSKLVATLMRDFDTSIKSSELPNRDAASMQSQYSESQILKVSTALLTTGEFRLLHKEII